MLVSAGMTLSVYCEMMACLNFIFNTDKNTLEFRVIDKNSKYDKLNLRETYNINCCNDNNSDETINKHKQIYTEYSDFNKKWKASEEPLLTIKQNEINEDSPHTNSTRKSSRNHVYYNTVEESPSLSITKDIKNEGKENNAILENNHINLKQHIK